MWIIRLMIVSLPSELATIRGGSGDTGLPIPCSVLGVSRSRWDRFAQLLALCVPSESTTQMKQPFVRACRTASGDDRAGGRGFVGRKVARIVNPGCRVADYFLSFRKFATDATNPVVRDVCPGLYHFAGCGSRTRGCGFSAAPDRQCGDHRPIAEAVRRVGPESFPCPEVADAG